MHQSYDRTTGLKESTSQVQPSLKSLRILKVDAVGHHPPPKGTMVLCHGPGFGSGNHPTTRMCLELLNRCFPRFSRTDILDAGTGSGILAIACALCGAHHVLGVDISTEAVQTARRNVILNHVEDRVTIRQGNAGVIEKRFGLIIANLCPHHVLKIADQLEKNLIRGGQMILSGLSGFNRERALKYFTEQGSLEHVGDRWEKGWSTLVLKKSLYVHERRRRSTVDSGNGIEN